MSYRNRKISGYSEVRVVSKAIQKLHYVYDRGSLTVTFIKGSVYRYYHVPLEVWCGLMAAPSKGKYFNENIRDKYNFEKN
jgi:hypothetical protein